MYQNIGIVASNTQRLQKCKWYNIFKRSKPDYFICEQIGIKFVISYNNQKSAKIFKNENVSIAIFSKQCKLFPINDVSVATGEKIYIKYLPFAVKKVSKELGLKDKPIAVIDNIINESTVKFIGKLQMSHRYITLVTENRLMAEDIADKMLYEYGLVLLIASPNEQINCRIAVNLSGTDCNLPKNTIIFDKLGEHNMKNINKVTRIINDFIFDVNISMPIPVKETALLEALEALNIKTVEFKPAGYLYDDKIVNLFDIS